MSYASLPDKLRERDRTRESARKRERRAADIETSRARSRAEMARYRQARRDERDAEAVAHREVSMLLLRWRRVS